MIYNMLKINIKIFIEGIDNTTTKMQKALG